MNSSTESRVTKEVPVDKCSGKEKGKTKKAKNEQEYSDMLIEFLKEDLG